MSLYISKIRIRNFRSLREVTVELSPNITVLTGANNAGKTTFLKALGIAFGTERRSLSKEDLFIGANGEPNDADTRISIDVLIQPGGGEQEFVESWAQEFGTSISSGQNNQEFFAFRTQSIVNELSGELEIERFTLVDWDTEQIAPGRFSANLGAIPYYYMDAQRDLLEDITKRTSAFSRLVGKIKYDPAQVQAIEAALAALNQSAVQGSEELRYLQEKLEELNTAVQTSGQGVQITPFSRRVRDIHKGMKVHFQDGNSDAFELEYHGMGTRSWASLLAFKAKISWESEQAADAYFPLLGLEEPEAHLHPNAQRQVYQQLKSIPGQKIVSTHSPYIAAQAGLEELRHFYKKTAQTTVNELNIALLTEDAKRKIKREILIAKGELLFSKAIILFEGETEAQVMPVFFQSYFQKEPYELACNLIDVHGGGNYLPYLLFAKAFGIKWFILSDFDNENVRRDLAKALTDAEEAPLSTLSNVITLGYNMEEYIVREGYQNDIKAGINAYCLISSSQDLDPRAIAAGQRRVNNMNDQDILKRLGNQGKTKYPFYWALEIIKRTDGREIPPKIRELFDAVNEHLFPPQPTQHDDANPE